MDEFDIGEQLPAAFSIGICQLPEVELNEKLPHIRREHVVARQRVDMQEYEDERRDGKGEGDRKARANLRDRNRAAAQQILVGGREGGGQ